MRGKYYCDQLIEGCGHFSLPPDDLYHTNNTITSMVKFRKWILKSHFSGLPKREDLEIVEEELPPLKDGGEPNL